MSDLTSLKKQQEEGGYALRKQLTEVEKKVSDLSSQISSDRSELEINHRDCGDDEEAKAEVELSILTRISESQRAIRTYQEHQRELKTRLDNGVLKESSLNKMNDLQVILCLFMSNMCWTPKNLNV